MCPVIKWQWLPTLQTWKAPLKYSNSSCSYKHLFRGLFSSVFLPCWGFFSSACSPGLRPSRPALLRGGARWLTQGYPTSGWIFNPLSREPGGSLPLCISHPNPHRPGDRDMETKRASEDHSDRGGPTLAVLVLCQNQPTGSHPSVRGSARRKQLGVTLKLTWQDSGDAFWSPTPENPLHLKNSIISLFFSTLKGYLKHFRAELIKSAEWGNLGHCTLTLKKITPYLVSSL